MYDGLLINERSRISKFDNTSHHGQEEISMGLLARSIRGGGGGGSGGIISFEFACQLLVKCALL